MKFQLLFCLLGPAFVSAQNTLGNLGAAPPVNTGIQVNNGANNGVQVVAQGNGVVPTAVPANNGVQLNGGEAQGNVGVQVGVGIQNAPVPVNSVVQTINSNNGAQITAGVQSSSNIPFTQTQTTADQANQIVNGVRQAISTSNGVNGNIVIGDSNNLTGSNNSLSGNGNTLFGDRNTANGDQNNVVGIFNQIFGSRSQLLGSNSLIQGDLNRVLGAQNGVIGNFNEVQGNINRLTGSFSDIYGNQNTVTGDNVNITGNGQIVNRPVSQNQPNTFTFRGVTYTRGAPIVQPIQFGGQNQQNFIGNVRGSGF